MNGLFDFTIDCLPLDMSLAAHKLQRTLCRRACSLMGWMVCHIIFTAYFDTPPQRSFVENLTVLTYTVVISRDLIRRNGALCVYVEYT